MHPVLETLADNPLLMDEFRKYLLAKFEMNYADFYGKENAELTDIIRARLTGRQMVEEAFREIVRLRKASKGATELNRAR